jgi:hypothetical protein
MDRFVKAAFPAAAGIFAYAVMWFVYGDQELALAFGVMCMSAALMFVAV